MIAIYVRALVSVKGASASALAQSDWHNLLGVTFHTVLAYAITFAIVISVVRIVRTLINRSVRSNVYLLSWPLLRRPSII